MSIITWYKARRARKLKKIDDDLMAWGLLCPDKRMHENELLEWEGNIRNMKCKNCGEVQGAMAKTI